MARQAWIAAATLALAITTAGCGAPSDPEPTRSAQPTVAASPTATPTPTLDAAEAEKQANIDAAKATYTAYLATSDEVEQAGGTGWEERVLPFLGTPELWDQRRSYHEQSVAQGLRQIGATKIAELTVAEYVGDPTGGRHEQVVLDACLDTSGADVVDPNGTSVLLPGFPTRLVTVVTMQRQGGDAWTVNGDATDQERPC